MIFSCVNFQSTGRSRHASTTRPLTDSPADTPRECARGRPDNRPVWLCTECAQCKDKRKVLKSRRTVRTGLFYPKIIAQKYLDYDTVGHARVSSTYPRSHQLLGFFSCYVLSPCLANISPKPQPTPPSNSRRKYFRHVYFLEQFCT